jgi:hypothetical protein
MASTTRDSGGEFIHEEDERVTARDVETGVAPFDDARAEALRMLADALDSYHGKGEPVDGDEPAAELALGGRQYLKSSATSFRQRRCRCQ